MFLDSLVINSLLMVLHYVLYTLYLPVVAALMDRPYQGWAPWTAFFSPSGDRTLHLPFSNPCIFEVLEDSSVCVQAALLCHKITVRS